MHRTTAFLLTTLAGCAAAFGAVASAHGSATAPPARIIFPVVGPTKFYDDFGEPRGGGAHQGNDILAERKAPVVAAEDGTVKLWTTSRGAGCMLYLYGRTGTTYLYIHLNNDLTAQNDNRGSCIPKVAYAPGLHDGQSVRAGELLGYVGDSGDADGIHPHLHFELHPGGGGAVSPFAWLRRASRLVYAAPNDAALPLTLTLVGTLRSTDPGDHGEPRLALTLRRVRLANGWSFKVDRGVVLRVPAEAVIEQVSQGGTRPAAIDDVQAGETLSATVDIAEPTLKTQIASPGVLAAARLLLRASRA